MTDVLSESCIEDLYLRDSCALGLVTFTSNVT